MILFRNVQTPLDIERTTGLTEGNIFQGELSLEQLFFNRPVPGYARFRTPIRDLWLCGSSTHPGRRDHGRERPDRGAGGAPGPRPEGRLMADGRAAGRRLGRGRRRRRPQRARHRGVPREGRPADARPRAARPRRRRGRDVRAGRGPGPAAGPHGRPAAAVGRPRPRPASRTACGSSRRTSASSRPQPDGRAVTLWADQARTVDGAPRLVAARCRRATRTSTGSSARSAGSSARSPSQTPPDIHAPGLGDALDRAEARADVPRPRQARRPHDPAGPADGRRRLRRRGVRDRRGPGRDRLARRPVLLARAVVGRAPTAVLLVRLGRQRRRRGRPDGLRRGRARRAGRGARRGGAGRRRGDPLRRRGRGRSRRATAGSPASRSRPGEEIAASTVVVRPRPEADARRARATRSRSGRRCCGGPATTGRRASWRRSTSSSPGCRGSPAAGGDDETLLRGRIVVAPGIDAIERAFDAAKYGRVSESLGARGDDPVARRPVARRRRAPTGRTS